MQSFLKMRRIDNIIVKNDHLNALQDKVTHLISLKKRILSTLSEPPPCDFTVIEFAQTTLQLSVNQAGFASRLRFLAPDWVQQLRQSDPEIWQYLAQIKIQVSPGQTAQGSLSAGKQPQAECILTRNNLLPKQQQQRPRPEQLIQAKELLSEQELRDPQITKTIAKSATSASHLPMPAKSHHLRQLIYESYDSPIHIQEALSSSNKQALTKKHTQKTKVGLKPDPLTECQALDTALEKLWHNVYGA